MIDFAQQLAAHSDSPLGLDCTYLGPAHRATAAQIHAWMRSAGLVATLEIYG